MVDSFGRILSADYTLSIVPFTFFGEVVLIVWLFTRASYGLPEQMSVDDDDNNSMKGNNK